MNEKKAISPMAMGVHAFRGGLGISDNPFYTYGGLPTGAAAEWFAGYATAQHGAKTDGTATQACDRQWPASFVDEKSLQARAMLNMIAHAPRPVRPEFTADPAPGYQLFVDIDSGVYRKPSVATLRPHLLSVVNEAIEFFEQRAIHEELDGKHPAPSLLLAEKLRSIREVPV